MHQASSPISNRHQADMVTCIKLAHHTAAFMHQVAHQSAACINLAYYYAVLHASRRLYAPYNGSTDWITKPPLQQSSSKLCTNSAACYQAGSNTFCCMHSIKLTLESIACIKLATQHHYKLTLYSMWHSSSWLTTL